MRLRVLSLGWGVQSWTLAAMTALGELPPLDYAIHADTGHEMSGTYAHARKCAPWLEERGVKVVTVHPTRNDVVREDWSASVLIPAFSSEVGDGRGQVKRQCTHDWKIMPIRRFIRSVLGDSIRPGSVELIQGISFDEWDRMRTSDVQYITNVYPLVDKRIKRADCILWLERHGLDVPPKSACTFCPYHSLGGWKELKRRGGSDWQEAVEVDTAIRHKRSLGAGKPGHEVQKGIELYVHPYRKPLAEAVSIPEDHGATQLAMDFIPERPCDSGYCFS